MEMLWQGAMAFVERRMLIPIVSLRILTNANQNIADLLNKSRGNVAYTIIDLDGEISAETLAKIRAIEGVLSLRSLG